MRYRVLAGWLIIFLFGGFTLGAMRDDVMAQGRPFGVPVGPTELVVIPNFPMDAEPIQIMVKGIWSNGCTPEYGGHSVVDSRIAVAFLPSTAEVCGQAITPWSAVVMLDALPVAEYQVEVRGSVTVSTTLTVVEERIYLPWIGNESDSLDENIRTSSVE